MTNPLRFGFDVETALAGARPESLTTPLTGQATNRAEAHLRELFPKSFLSTARDRTDDQGKILPLPVLTSEQVSLFMAKCGLHSGRGPARDTTDSIISTDIVDTGSRRVRILWFMDQSGIMLEELSKGRRACLPVSLFLSKFTGHAQDLAPDVEIWAAAMRRMPRVARHLTLNAHMPIDIAPDETIPPWIDWFCQHSTLALQLSPVMRELTEYVTFARHFIDQSQRIEFQMKSRVILRDGSLSDATIETAGQLTPEVEKLHRELTGIADHPDFPVTPQQMIYQRPKSTNFASPLDTPDTLLAIGNSLSEFPSAHEFIEARARIAHWLNKKEAA